MFVPTITVIVALVLSAEADQDAACPQCTHISYELRNVPTFIATQLDLQLTSLSNPACESNTVQPQTCQALRYPAWIEHKCLTAQVTLKAVNMLGLPPDAEMFMTMTNRDCPEQWLGEVVQEGCISLSELDAATQGQFTQLLEPLSAQWESVTIKGEVCLESL